jgi:exonuclease V
MSEAEADEQLGDSILEGYDTSAIGVENFTVKNLLSVAVTWAQELVCISAMEVEYIHQGTNAVIGQLAVEVNCSWIEPTFKRCMDFWHGRRDAEGVEIEEAWKCGKCEFYSLCEWRASKAKETVRPQRKRSAHSFI